MNTIKSCMMYIVILLSAISVLNFLFDLVLFLTFGVKSTHKAVQFLLQNNFYISLAIGVTLVGWLFFEYRTEKKLLKNIFAICFIFLLILIFSYLYTAIINCKGLTKSSAGKAIFEDVYKSSSDPEVIFDEVNSGEHFQDGRVELVAKDRLGDVCKIWIIQRWGVSWEYAGHQKIREQHK